jgi:hypothetical protein
MDTISPTLDADILTAVIAPGSPTLEPAAAEWLAKLSFSDEQKEQMHQLAEKNNQGVISSDERSVLEGYLRVGSFLNLVKAKARNSLGQAAG